MVGMLGLILMSLDRGHLVGVYLEYSLRDSTNYTSGISEGLAPRDSQSAPS